MQDFMDGLKRVVAEKPNALMVGRRWNVDIKELIKFDAEWQKTLASLVARKGKLYPYFAIDYFVFPRNGLGKLPTFAIGRPAWDNSGNLPSAYVRHGSRGHDEDGDSDPRES